MYKMPLPNIGAEIRELINIFNTERTYQVSQSVVHSQNTIKHMLSRHNKKQHKLRDHAHQNMSWTIKPGKYQIINFSHNKTQPSVQIKIYNQESYNRNRLQNIWVSFRNDRRFNTITAQFYPFLEDNSKLNTKIKVRLYKTCNLPTITYVSAPWCKQTSNY